MQDHWDPVAHYDRYGEAEWDRLRENLYGELEFEETCAVLEWALPVEGHVLDVGAGPGRYTRWLGRRGYEVTAVEPSSTQRRLARETVAEASLDDRVTVTAGDVRRLPLENESADATLCLGGPLSHVLAAPDRSAAARELARVTVPDGPVFVSVMGLLAALQTIARVAGRKAPSETELLAPLARSGTYDAALLESHDLEPTSPPMHLFRAQELVALLRAADMRVVGVTGLEGVASQRRTDEGLDEGDREAIKDAVAALRWDPAVADLSGHMLALGRA
ncbi:MAG: class I SAM-dependent methyltransferase [Halobacteriaceae archaeon]